MQLSGRLVFLAGAIAPGAGAVACTDPETAKRRHLERGDRLTADGQYQEAILEYRRALRAGDRFGEDES
jgi:hypothetical protein